MACRKITTTLEENLFKLAKKQGIPWAYALEFGLRKLLNKPAELLSHETIEYIKPEIKIKRIQDTMQNTINDLNDEIAKLRGKS